MSQRAPVELQRAAPQGSNCTAHGCGAWMRQGKLSLLGLLGSLSHTLVYDGLSWRVCLLFFCCRQDQ
jgi:hypothetical protein